jgi:hypothetical protein
MKISRIERASFATGLITIDCLDCKIVLEFDLGHFHFADSYFLDITVYPGESTIPIDRIYRSRNRNGGIRYFYSRKFPTGINAGILESLRIAVEQNLYSIPGSHHASFCRYF